MGDLLWLLLAFIVGLLVGGGIVVMVYHQRNASRRGSGQDEAFIGRGLPAERTLDGLEQWFEERIVPPLLGRRLARIYAILFAPALVLPHLDEPWLAEQVEQEHLVNNTALFRGVAALECACEGRTFGDKPANTMGVYLRRQFVRRAWPWPTHPLAWKAYFMKYYGSEKEGVPNTV